MDGSRTFRLYPKTARNCSELSKGDCARSSRYRYASWRSCTSALVFLFFVLSPVIVSTSARGYDWEYEEVVLRPNNLGKDRAFLAAYLREYGPWSPEPPPYSAVKDPQELKKMLKGLRIARYDLTGDGRPELIVGGFGSEWCGSAGCQGLIFEMRNGEWEYAWFQPDGARKTGDNVKFDRCFECHKGVAEQDFNFTLSPFVKRMKGG